MAVKMDEYRTLGTSDPHFVFTTNLAFSGQVRRCRRKVNSSPKYIRLVYYNYEFTSLREREESSRWWKRQARGLLGGRPFTLTDFAK